VLGHHDRNFDQQRLLFGNSDEILPLAGDEILGGWFAQFADTSGVNIPVILWLRNLI